MSHPLHEPPRGSELITLTYAGGVYDRTTPLATGQVVPAGIRFSWRHLSLIEIFRRMLRNQEFEAAELSCANYLQLYARGDRRFIALPVFPSRVFRHSSIYVNPAAGIGGPADLRGKRVGCLEYTMTMAVWVRAMLLHEHDVPPNAFTWVQGGIEQPISGSRVDVLPPPDVTVEAAPEGRTLLEMLEAGEIDALLAPNIPSTFKAGSPHIARLFPDFPTVEADYFRRTGIFPIMHTVVMRRDAYEANPWAARSLYDAFCASKDLANERLYDLDALKVGLAWTAAYYERERALLGPDPWAYGLAANRSTLVALTGYLQEQGLLAEPIAIEEVFAPSTRDT